jgi:Na+/H+-translocating membrane pyrophosphatase
MSPWAQASFGLFFGALSFVIVVFFTLKVMCADYGQEQGDQPEKKKLIRISHIVHQGAKTFLYWEYLALSGFVTVVAIALVFMLMNVSYDESCDDPDALGDLGYTPYLKSAICDNVTWKEYTAGVWTAISFVVGAVFSASAGFAGMFIATKANSRTAIAANAKTGGFQAGLSVAFASGAVMSFSVIALGLSGVSLLYCAFSHISRDHVWDYVSGFGAGGSAIALFARVGGGIYTKAADCGADLVGKVEAGFDEDSPHNPAVIADNIGDNVGDVAGMGADLFESYVGSIIAAAAIGNNVDELRKMYPLRDTLEFATAETIQLWRNHAQALPFWIAGCGVLASVIGVILTRAWVTTEPVPKDEWAELYIGTYEADLGEWHKKIDKMHVMKDAASKKHRTLFWEDKNPQEPDLFYQSAQAQPAPNDPRFIAAKDRAYGEYKMLTEELLGEQLLWSLRIGVAIAATISLLLSLGCCIVLFGGLDWFLAFRVWFCIVIGLLAGIIIGSWTEYCTAFYSPVISISKQGLMSPATVIIQGLGVGMISCVVPCITIVIAIVLCDKCASFYGISIAAVGMLSTLGVTLATDAYGPVADNAGGLAEMCSELSLGELLQKITQVAQKLQEENPAVTEEIISKCSTIVSSMPDNFGDNMEDGFPSAPSALEDGGETLVSAIVSDLRAIHKFGVQDASQGDVESALEPIHEMVELLSEPISSLLAPEISENVRDITDALDALGNTTAATGKGFAIGSAVLTSSGLIAAYINSAKIDVINLGEPIVVAGLLLGAMLPFLFAALTMLSVGRAAEMIILQVRNQLYEVMAVVAKPNGVTRDDRWSQETCNTYLSACRNSSPVYSSLFEEFATLGPAPGDDVKRWEAVLKIWRFDGRASEIQEILDINDEFLDDIYVYWTGSGRSAGAYFKDCTGIATKSSLAEMITPGAIAVLSPPIVGFLMGRLALAGLLIGALSSGFMLAITMSNAGGAWDNAKKYVEKGNFGGKYLKDELGNVLYVVSDTGIKKKAKNPVHDANVIGDTVGDPFKDTSGPALNILIKLMSVMALVLAPRFAQISDDKGFVWDNAWGGGWWISICLMGILVAILAVANIIIFCNVNKFKKDLEAKKERLNAISGAVVGESVESDYPAMSPRRKEEERKQLAKELEEDDNEKEIEMVTTTSTSPPVPPSSEQQEEEAAVEAQESAADAAEEGEQEADDEEADAAEEGEQEANDDDEAETAE